MLLNAYYSQNYASIMCQGLSPGDVSATDQVICAHGEGLLSNGVEHVGGVENPIVVCERVYISTIDSGRGID